jgi:hypothetical protein
MIVASPSALQMPPQARISLPVRLTRNRTHHESAGRVFSKEKKPGKFCPLTADYCIDVGLLGCGALFQPGSRPI